MKQQRARTGAKNLVLRTLITSLMLSYASNVFADNNPYSQTFTAFESGQVRPLAITPDKKFLLAVNTPDAKLEVFRINSFGLEHQASVPVGLEPVSVAVDFRHPASELQLNFEEE